MNKSKKTPIFHKETKVHPLPGFLQAVSFENGAYKIYDLNPLFSHWEAFKALQSIKGLFECVQVDPGGYGISWNDEIDLSCVELYENGREEKAIDN